MSVCVSDSEAVCTKPPSVTCNRRKARTNNLQQATHIELGLTISTAHNNEATLKSRDNDSPITLVIHIVVVDK